MNIWEYGGISERRQIRQIFPGIHRGNIVAAHDVYASKAEITAPRLILYSQKHSKLDGPGGTLCGADSGVLTSLPSSISEHQLAC